MYEPLTTMDSSKGTAELLLKLDYLIEKCRAGRLHNIVVLADVEGEGHRLTSLFCMDDAHAMAFIDRSITALNEVLEKDFDKSVDSEVH